MILRSFRSLPPRAALFVVVLALGGCREFPLDPLPGERRDEPQSFTVQPDSMFEFRVGDTVAIEGTNKFVQFRLIVGDSRCPSNVDCIHPGQADILLIVSNSLDDAEYQVLATMPGRVAQPFLSADTIQFEDLGIRFMGLTPYPLAGIQTRESEYVASMTISALTED
ncbi:MAG: hypothetical protein RIE53_13080 [Rhodothermales bacterium]